MRPDRDRPGHRPSGNARAWTLEELRQAAALGYGSTRTGRPQVGSLAAAVGVSPTTVRRWLSGGSSPLPQHRAALRAALLPEAQVLARQADELAWAQQAARAMQTARGRALDARWIERQWHRPHRLLVLADEGTGLHRPAIELARRARPQQHRSAAWRPVDVVELPHRPAALIVRGVLLEAVAPWRVRVRPGLIDGHTLCWLAAAPTPLLGGVAHACGYR